jgi:hypothetical protein
MKGGLPLTGNVMADKNLHEIAKNERILQAFGGSRKRKTRKRKVRKRKKSVVGLW